MCIRDSLELIKAERNYRQKLKELQTPPFDEYSPTKMIELTKEFNEYKSQLNTPNSELIPILIKSADKAISLLRARNWMLVEADSSQFITSNNPFGIFPTFFSKTHFKYLGLGTYPTIVTFPLTPKFALLGSFSPLPTFNKVDPLIVDGINYSTFCNADTIYSRDEIIPFFFTNGIYLQEFHRLLSTRLISNS